jgi:SAM-dependent methyltransferase
MRAFAPPNRRGRYGFDAPYVLLGLAVASACAALIGLVGLLTSMSWLAALGFANAAWFGGSTLSFLWTTRVGKFAVWEELLDELPLRGSERVLDVGCGRGAVLVLTAKRLTSGAAVGIDIWSQHGQSGNTRDIAVQNAELEGVSERISLHTADARSIPFPDESFDVVTSSLVLHHVRDATERGRCLDEIVRVLKLGGVALVADLRFTASYAEHCRRAPNTQVELRRLDHRFWYGGPHAATSLLVLRKRSISAS